MTPKLLAILGFDLGAVFLLMAATFLAFYFFKPKPGPKKELKRRILWLVLGGCSYLLSLGALILVIVTYFSMHIPSMGDFNGITWEGDKMTVGNADGAFEITGISESVTMAGGKPYHTIAFTLTNDFDGPVTLQACRVISRINGKEVEGYASKGLPMVLDKDKSFSVEVGAPVSNKILELAEPKNKDDYGTTAYLQVVTSEGKLPGIPLHFPDKPNP